MVIQTLWTVVQITFLVLIVYDTKDLRYIVSTHQTMAIQSTVDLCTPIRTLKDLKHVNNIGFIACYTRLSSCDDFAMHYMLSGPFVCETAGLNLNHR